MSSGRLATGFLPLTKALLPSLHGSTVNTPQTARRWRLASLCLASLFVSAGGQTAAEIPAPPASTPPVWNSAIPPRPSEGEPRITSLSVDGKTVAIDQARCITLPPRARTDLKLEFSPFGRATAGPAGSRLLFRLDGLDADWRDVGGEMRLSVVFRVDGTKQIGSYELFMLGKSPGWKGTLAESEWSSRAARIPVPEGADKVGIALWSGGPSSTVGVLAIGEISILEDIPGERPRHTFPIDDGMSGWERFGSDSRSATILRIKDRPALCFIDADPGSFGGWRTLGTTAIDVTPGEGIVVEWQEIFSVGGNQVERAEYRDVPPGLRRFRLAAATTEGVPTGVERATEILLPPPLWWRPWFWAACGAVATAMILGIWRYASWNRLRIRMADLQKAHALDAERGRIARDLHDELGANLTQIAIASDLTRENLTDPVATRQQLDTIFSTAQALVRKLDAVVWAISPAEDSAESLAGFLGQASQRYLAVSGIACRLQMPDELPAVSISSLTRRTIFLVLQEALHNVVRHAGASEVRIRMAVEGGRLSVEVEDDGRGMPAEILAGRHSPGEDGLANMRCRMASIGGAIAILPAREGAGTLVRITFPVTVDPSSASDAHMTSRGTP